MRFSDYNRFYYVFITVQVFVEPNIEPKWKHSVTNAAAATKSLQLCLTLCDPIEFLSNTNPKILTQMQVFGMIYAYYDFFFKSVLSDYKWMWTLNTYYNL